MKTISSIFKKASSRSAVAGMADDDSTVLLRSETSTIASECSTLVDFDLDEVKSIPTDCSPSEDESDEYLDEENMCWNRPASRPKPNRNVPIKVLKTGCRTESRCDEVDTLDMEQSAWSMPRQRRFASPSSQRRRWKRSSHSATGIATKTVLSHDLLEPEERSWM